MNPGDYIVVTNLIPPRKNDLIVFLRNDSLLGISYFGSRLVAKEKDTVKMINSALFVNGINVDIGLTLKHSYKVRRTQLENYKHLAQNEFLEYFPIGNSNFICHMRDDIASSLDEKAIRIDYLDKTDIAQSLFEKNWNIDNFGPYIVPNNSFFVIGDNRHNSIDSRSYGPIKYSNYIGKVLKKNK